MANGILNPRRMRASGIHGMVDSSSRKSAPGVPPMSTIKIFLPALPHCAEGAVHANADDSLPRTKPQAEAGGLGTLGESDVFEDFCRDAVVAADGIVGVALNHQELSVSGRGGRGGIVYGVVGKMFCKAAVDERNERFLVPGLRDLLRRKGDQRRAFFLRDLQRASGRAGLQFGVGVGEKQPGALGFFRA